MGYIDFVTFGRDKCLILISYAIRTSQDRFYRLSSFTQPLLYTIKRCVLCWEATVEKNGYAIQTKESELQFERKGTKANEYNYVSVRPRWGGSFATT